MPHLLIWLVNFNQKLVIAGSFMIAFMAKMHKNAMWIYFLRFLHNI